MKRALVLSGGGAKGAWQAGVITRLHEHGANFDAYFGVSVGALNAAHMAQYSSGYEASVDLEPLWSSINNRSIWKHHNRWLRWLVVPWYDSVYDTSPLRELLASHLSTDRMRTSGKHLGVGLVNLHTGGYEVHTAKSPDIINAVYGSSAFPIMFEPGMVQGHPTTDGGVVHVTPLRAAIEWGATHVTAITLDPEGIPAWTVPQRKWWQPRLQDMVLRTLDVMTQHIVEADLAKCQRINDEVTHGTAHAGRRHIDLRIIRPETPIPIGSLDFDPADIRTTYAQGYAHV